MRLPFIHSACREHIRRWGFGMSQPEPKCRICGTGLRTGVPYMPDPLLPGDLPGRDELCASCVELAAVSVVEETNRK